MTYYFHRAQKILSKEGLISLLKRVIRKIFHEGIKDQNLLYKNWIERKETPYLNSEKVNSEKIIGGFRIKPKISILMPVYNVPLEIFKEAIVSIQKQWYQNWELCIYDDHSTKSELIEFFNSELKELSTTDSRVKILIGDKNQNISIATNKAYELSSGGFLMLMDNDDVVRENCLYEVVKEINKNPKLDLIYFDEDKLDRFDERIEPFFKPQFSPELLWSMMYPTHAVYSRKIFEKAGKMRAGFEGSQDYDLMLRVSELTEEIIRIPWVLYSWRKVEGSTADNISGKSYALISAKKTLEEALNRRNLKGKVKNDFYPFDIEFELLQEPTVEIIIPIKDKIGLLKDLVTSIRENTIYSKEKLTITIVDNNSVESETLSYLSSLKNEVDFTIKLLKYDKEYNFSAINNFVAKQSKADALLFMNNDMRVITKDWLRKLIVWVIQKNIGAVGCKLLYPNGYIQHAGVLLGVGGVANHAYYKTSDMNDFYFNNLHTIRNYLAVTGACMAIRRDVFESVGGFEETLPRAFNDVDLCLKIYEKGYRNVYTPNVEIIHLESMTREPEVTTIEDRFMREKWEKYIKDDPYYNPNLNRDLTKGYPFEVTHSF